MAALTVLLFAATFAARSANYALDVTCGDTAKVVLTDLQTNAVLVSEEMPWGSAPLVRDVGDRHITIHVFRSPQAMNASADIEQGEMLVDSIHADWMLAPRRAHVHADGAMRVGGSVHAPRVIDRVEPKYTDEARKNRVSGIVIVEARVDETGRVTDAVVLKPLPFGLAESALDAVKQWRWEPGTLDGKRVPVIFNLTVNFRLDAPPAAPVQY